jgi:hypothetical protein
MIDNKQASDNRLNQNPYVTQNQYPPLGPPYDNSNQNQNYPQQQAQYHNNPPPAQGHPGYYTNPPGQNRL